MLRGVTPEDTKHSLRSNEKLRMVHQTKQKTQRIVRFIYMRVPSRHKLELSIDLKRVLSVDN